MAIISLPLYVPYVGGTLKIIQEGDEYEGNPDNKYTRTKVIILGDLRGEVSRNGFLALQAAMIHNQEVISKLKNWQ